MPSTTPEKLILDVHVFKRNLCEYMRRLQAGEVDIMIQRYRKPVAFVLSKYHTDLRQKARVAEEALNAALSARKRHATERRRIFIHARLHWPREKFDPFAFGNVGQH